MLHSDLSLVAMITSGAAGSLEPDSMAWHELFKQGIAALNRSDYNEAIENTSRAIEAFNRTQLVSILDVRAEAYGKNNDYQNALKDAHTIIQHAPESAIGYLRAGDLYTMQCNYGEAIDIYDLGIYSVSADQQALIQRKRHEAEQRQYRKLDFMRVLPFDVISVILGELSLDEWFVCMDVCRLWREMIPRCMACRHMDIRLWGRSQQQDDRTAKFIGPHAHSVRLSRTASSHATQSLLEILGDRCQSLRSLVFDLCQISLDDVRPVLRRIGHHLTDVHINVAPASDLTIDPLLKLCPNLTCFTFHLPLQQQSRLMTTINNDRDPTTPRDTSLLSITYLSIDVSRDVLPIESLLQRCPKLRYLIIPFRPEDNGRQTIAPDQVLDLCPDIEYFDFHASLAQDSFDTPQSYQQHQSGISAATARTDEHPEILRELYIGSLDGYSGDVFMPLLERARYNLERLHIGMGAGDQVMMEEWTGLASLYFSKLESFHCSIACSTHFFNAMLRRCPCLTDLEFSEIPITDEVFDAIVSAAQLQRLALSHCHGISEMGLQRFIRYRAIALHEIDLTQCRAVGDSLLEALGENCHSLRMIRLSDNPRVTQKGLLVLVQGLVQAPASHLHTLVLKYMHAVTAGVLHGLRDLERLENIDICGSSGVTDIAIHMLVDQNPQLRYLNITNCSMITQIAIEYARSHLTSVITE